MYDKVEHMKKIGEGNRKHEEVCDYCGDDNHYAKGLCRNCYARLLRKGTVEKIVAKPKPELRKKRRDFILENAKPIDERDKYILVLLDGGFTYNEIGKVLGITKQGVNYIIERMMVR